MDTEEERARYNWPAYEAIQDFVQKTQQGKARKTIDLLSRTPRGTKRHPVPSEDNKAWDITAGGKNFQTRCTLPYWHESHHIIPDGAFQAAIAEAATGEPLEPVYVRLIRGGLLREKYNLNHTHNMIILPMAKEVAHALGLPRHRVSRGTLSHEAYSDKVRTDLDRILKPVQSDAKKHRKKPDYADCKKQLMDLSGTYRKDILDAGESMKAAGELENNALENAFEGDAAAGSL